MTDLVWECKRRKYTVLLYTEDQPCDPREDDNVGHMVCFHRNYTLGDEIHYSFPKGKNYCTDTQNETYGSGKFLDPGHARAVLAEIEKEGGVCLPLYLYDHSGLSMSCSPFSCPWDSGQVGVIYATKEEIDKEWGGSVELAEEYLRGEVDTYDMYLRNDVYCYGLIRRTDDVVVDSCCGFYGFDYAKEAAMDVLDSYEPESALPPNVKRGKAGSKGSSQRKEKHVKP